MDNHEQADANLESRSPTHSSNPRVIPETPFGTQEQLEIEESSPLHSQEPRQHELCNSPANDRSLTANNDADLSAERPHPSEEITGQEVEQSPKQDDEEHKTESLEPTAPLITDNREVSDSNDGSSSENFAVDLVDRGIEVEERPAGTSLKRTLSTTEESIPNETQDIQTVTAEADKASTEHSSFHEQIASAVTEATPVPQEHDTHTAEPTQQTLPITQTSFSSSSIKMPPSSPTKLPPSSPTKLTQSSPSKPPKPQNSTLLTLTDRKNALLQAFRDHPNLPTHLPPGADASIMDEAALLTTATGITQRHIKLLHAYNEIRDVGMGLMGLISEARGVRIKDVQEEFGIEAKD